MYHKKGSLGRLPEDAAEGIFCKRRMPRVRAPSAGRRGARPARALGMHQAPLSAAHCFSFASEGSSSVTTPSSGSHPHS